MSFDWNAHLARAHRLATVTRTATPATTEARRRAAISRAYYAAFCLARNRLRDRDRVPIPLSGAAHVVVADAFKRSADRSRRAIGYELERLRRMRNVAGYDDDYPGLAGAVRVALRRAEDVVTSISNMP